MSTIQSRMWSASLGAIAASATLLLGVTTVVALTPTAAHAAATRTATWPSTWKSPLGGTTVAVTTNYGAFDLGCPNADDSHGYTYYLPTGRTEHLGLDLDSEQGNNVYSIGAGTVKNAGTLWGAASNEVLIIEHTASGNVKFIAAYGHIAISNNPATGQKWKAGDSVSAGNIKVGTIDYPTGAHLHFGIEPGTGTSVTPTVEAPGTGNCAHQPSGTVDPLPYLSGNTQDPTEETLLPDYARTKSAKADFNGDGNDDVAIAHKTNPGTNFWVFTSTGSALNSNVLWRQQTNFTWEDLQVVAANLDGNSATDAGTDLVVMHRASSAVNLWWLRSTGTGFAAPVLARSAAGFNYDSSKLTAADFNGDGNDDVAIAHKSSSAVNFWVFTSTGSALNSNVLWRQQTNFTWEDLQVVAANVDANSPTDAGIDLVVMHRASSGPNLWWLRSTGSGFAPPALGINATGFNYDSSKLAAGDFNNDGNDDVAIVHNASEGANFWVFTSTGSALNSNVLWAQQTNYTWEDLQILPANLDANSSTDAGVDLIVMHRAGSAVNLWWSRSTGANFAQGVLARSATGFNYDSSKLA